MSETKKRCRKGKLVNRSDVCCDETENTILQKPPLLLPEPELMILDHTYSQISLQNVSPQQLPMQLSVKVEVEEFDETIMNADNGETNKNMRRPLPGPSNMSNKTLSRKAAAIQVFNINLEKMFKISDHITWSSINPADNHLNIEMRNCWGRVLKYEEPDDPHNSLIQKALKAWGLGLINGRFWRESPIFYQCHICNIAWWTLHPFREHIKTHDHTKLKVYHQENLQESIIVASDRCSSVLKYIPCEGNCYRCGRGYEFHKRTPDKLYICLQCFDSLGTCSVFKHHQPVCYNTPTPKTLPNLSKCSICCAEFLSEPELDVHLITSHIVRSDEPCPFSFKTCAACGKKYHSYNTHVCSKSAMNVSCTYCYRKFATKTLAAFHLLMTDKNVTCKICGEVLSRKCMETEHMLIHTNRYRLVYKCTHMQCSPTTLFPDEKSIRLHRAVHHKQKIDRRRNFYERVLIPEQCAKIDPNQEFDFAAACQGIPRKELQCQEAYIDAVWSQNNQRNEQTNKEIVTESINIKQEIEDIITDYSISETSQDEEMDEYEQMLSKVFKVTDSVRTHQISTGQAETIKVKTEPVEEIDFEDLIDIQENPIIIKKEVLQVNGTYNKKQTVGLCHIKTEPEDVSTTEVYEIPSIFDESLITAVKIEPDDVELELIEATDFEIMGSLTEPSNPDKSAYKSEKSANKSEKCANKLNKSAKKSDKSVNKLQKSPLNTATKTLEISPDTSDTNSVEETPDTTDTNPVEINPDISHSKPIHVSQIVHDKKTLEIANTYKNKTKRKFIMKRDNMNHILKPFTKKNGKIRKVYKCSRCGYMNHHRLYRIHMNSKCEQTPLDDENGTYGCTKCCTSHGTLKSYLTHFQRHGYEFMTCPSCNVNFEDLKELLAHFHKHVRQSYVNIWVIDEKLDVPMKQHSCRTCREFVHQDNFFRHWEKHLILKAVEIKTEPETLDDDVQNETVNSKRILQTSVLNTVLQQLRSVFLSERDCLVCLRKFTRRHDYKRHLIEHLLSDAFVKKPETDQKLRCQICYRFFMAPEKYKFHMREHGGLPVYRCELCDKTFSDSSNFAKHKKVHSLKVLICDICNKKFHTKSELVKHLLMHEKTEPIKCDKCSLQFYTNSQYRKHYKSRHEHHQAKFKCHTCDIAFDCLRKKWDHMWNMHTERKHKADCPVCHKQYRKFQELKTHTRQEHGMLVSFYNMKSANGKHVKTKTIRKVKNSRRETLLIPYDFSTSS